jgi:hypothetical protein
VRERFVGHNLRLLVDDEVTAVRFHDAIAARHEWCSICHRAFSHFVDTLEPTPIGTVDHWELRMSELGDTGRLK